MTEFLSVNLGTIIVALLLLILVAAIIVILAVKRKKGQNNCGLGCDNCPMRDNCNK